MQKITKKTQKGFTLIELLIVIAVIAILAAIAIPNLLASRKAANEASAISAERTLVSAEETYRSRQNPPTYATMAQLLSSSLVDSVLGAGAKSGYTYTTGTIDANNYSFIAKATTQGTTGDRSFYVDQTGVIRSDPGAAAASGSLPIQ